MDAKISNPDILDLPWKELFELQPRADMAATLNPAPRISILHALSHPKDYIKQASAREASPPRTRDRVSSAAMDMSPNETTLTESGTHGTSTPSRKRKRRIESPEPDSGAHLHAAGPVENSKTNDTNGIALKGKKGDLEELGVLFNLWKSAGRNVNLWDWLEAFRISMDKGESHPNGKGAKDVADKRTEDVVEDAVDEKRKRRKTAVEIEIAEANGINGDSVEAVTQNVVHEEVNGEAEDEAGREVEDDETAARLHATFVRFCEEARMMGLVRARGKGVGRRVDDVVKGIGLI